MKNLKVRKVFKGLGFTLGACLVIGVLAGGIWAVMDDVTDMAAKKTVQLQKKQSTEVLMVQEQTKAEEATRVQAIPAELETLQHGDLIVFPRGTVAVFQDSFSRGFLGSWLQLQFNDTVFVENWSREKVVRAGGRVVKIDSTEWCEFIKRYHHYPRQKTECPRVL